MKKTWFFLIALILINTFIISSRSYSYYEEVYSVGEKPDVQYEVIEGVEYGEEISPYQKISKTEYDIDWELLELYKPENMADANERFQVMVKAEIEPEPEPVPEPEPEKMSQYNIWNTLTQSSKYFMAKAEAEGGEEPEYNHKNYVKQLSAYLDENGVQFDTGDEMNIIYDELGPLRTKSLILTGETHWTDKTFEMLYHFITYFNETYGIKHVFIETGFASSQVLNEYIHTGDEALLDKYLSTYAYSSSSSVERREFLKKLCAYNAGLDEWQKIKIYGADLEYAPQMAKYYIGRLVGDKEIPRHLQGPIQKTMWIMGNYDNMWMGEEKLGEFTALINNNTEALSEFFGKDMFLFELTVRNYIQLCRFQTDPDSDMRERFMADNIASVMDYYEIERAYGQFGSFHTRHTLPEGSNAVTIADYFANHYGATENKVVTIEYAYYDSEFLVEGEPQTIEHYSYIKKAAENMEKDYKLINLMKEESPFVYENGLVTGHQYMLIIKNSGAVTLYSPYE